jgi:hypothetical protein
MQRRFAAFLFLALASTSLRAQAPEVGLRRLRIPRVERAPRLSDYLEGVPREAELVIEDFRQYQPGDGVPVSQATKAFLSYDSKNLYVGFIFKDDPKLIRSRVAKREQIMSDDRISICIDTFHDHRHMYWFDVNAYGVQADGNVTDGVEDDPSWDTVWHSEARITSDGFTGLAAIPFKSIRFPKDAEQTWGLIVGRWIMRNNEFSLWPTLSQRQPGFVRQGGDLEGFHDISPGRNIQLTPYVLGAASRFLDQTPAVRTSTEARAGLDAKIVLKDAFTLDVALNPDFSQVESDEPQVTVNQRFEVVYPEKRPFFLENAGYFKTPLPLFFSRRIADPRLGARLTGKTDGWSVGALFADDRAPGEAAPRDDARSGSQAIAGVVRIQRDFLKDSNAAVMVTSEDFGPTHKRVFSFDTRLHILRNWILTAQLMTSDTRLTDGSHAAGPGYDLKWEHSGRHFFSQTEYLDLAPGFTAQLGYFERVDIRKMLNTTGWQWKPEGNVVQSFGPYFTYVVDYDHHGTLQDWIISPEFNAKLTRLTEIETGHEEIYENFGGIGFRRHTNRVKVKSQPKKWLAFNVGLTAGTGINYHPGPGLLPFLGRMRQWTGGLTLRPGPRTRLDETYIFDNLRTTGAAVFNNHIVRSKLNYQFTRQASLRLIADYNAVLPNVALAQLDKVKHFGIDALFTYMLNPGTALHAGYTDLYDNWRLDPTVSPALTRSTFPDFNTGRQVFVKVSYLLRF